MINALLALLAFQLLGEVLARALSLPLPGPVLGMLLLFVALRLRRGVPAPLEQASHGLLDHLSLLFVPAGVGVVAHLELLRGAWWQLLIATAISTVATLLVTAGVMGALLRRGEG